MKAIEILKALADETRLRIITLLTHGELNVQELMTILALPQSNISRHLAFLKNAGLVTSRRKGVSIYYALNRQSQPFVHCIFDCLNSNLKDEPILQRDYASYQKQISHYELASEHSSEKPVKKILFVCSHNSARSQMAETFANLLGKGEVAAESAGLEPGSLNQYVVEVMKEKNIDITENKTKSVFELFKQGRLYNYVITVCDESVAEQCPTFPGILERIHWSFADPSTVEGSYNEKLNQIREIRDQIYDRVSELIHYIYDR